MSLFDEMENAQGIDANEILSKLVTGKENLEQKTEILDPIAMMMLQVLAVMCRSYLLTRSAETLEAIVEFINLDMISYKRKSREEVIFALAQMFKDKELTIKQELLGSPKKKGWGH